MPAAFDPRVDIPAPLSAPIPVYLAVVVAVLFFAGVCLMSCLSGCGGPSLEWETTYTHHAILFAQQTMDGNNGFCKASWHTPGLFVTGRPHDEEPDPSGQCSVYGTVDSLVYPPGDGGWFYVLEGYADPLEGPTAPDDIHLRAWVAIRWRSGLAVPPFRYVLTPSGALVENGTYCAEGILIDYNPSWRPTAADINLYRETTP